jgi:hypothetical protein
MAYIYCYNKINMFWGSIFFSDSIYCNEIYIPCSPRFPVQFFSPPLMLAMVDSEDQAPLAKVDNKIKFLQS